jgi:hypothetical protein
VAKDDGWEWMYIMNVSEDQHPIIWMIFLELKLFGLCLQEVDLYKPFSSACICLVCQRDSTWDFSLLV